MSVSSTARRTSILPPRAPLRKHQRHAHRFWNTADMMEALSVYYGMSSSVYPKTWEYRILITVHRELQSKRAARIYGYGKDWKGEIKRDLEMFLKEGTIPLPAKGVAAELIREADMKVWQEGYAARTFRPRSSLPVQQAAE